MSIDISDDLHAKMQARAAATGHATVEEYLAWLVRSDADPVDYGAPVHLTVTSRSRLEALLQEAIDSPAREVRAEDWDERRRRLIERYRGSNGE